jgi:acyl-CoA thioester hydrolase
MAVPDPRVTEVVVRVAYADTDRMGVAHHARYAVWLEIARTEHLRGAGQSYREVEDRGLLLSVVALSIRYRSPARYDDLVRVRCWVREVASRRVTFGYAVERAETGELLATATTALMATDHGFAITRLPEALRALLVPCPDPVRV